MFGVLLAESFDAARARAGFLFFAFFFVNANDFIGDVGRFLFVFAVGADFDQAGVAGLLDIHLGDGDGEAGLAVGAGQGEVPPRLPPWCR